MLGHALALVVAVVKCGAGKRQKRCVYSLYYSSSVLSSEESTEEE